MCVLKYGSILAFPRDFICAKSNYLKELFQCSLCLGFWTGVIICLFIHFVLDGWDNKYYLFPFFSSVTCWTADPIIGILSYTETYLVKKISDS